MVVLGLIIISGNTMIEDMLRTKELTVIGVNLNELTRKDKSALKVN